MLLDNIPNLAEYVLGLPEYIPVLPEYIPVLPEYFRCFRNIFRLLRNIFLGFRNIFEWFQNIRRTILERNDASSNPGASTGSDEQRGAAVQDGLTAKILLRRQEDLS